MIEAFLIVAGGILGAGHCIGMCGGFVLTLGSRSQRSRSNLARQLVYAGGRIATYVLAGAFVGFGATKLGFTLEAFAPVQAILALIAGILLIAEGVFSLGLAPRPFAAGATCPGASAFATLLRAPKLPAVFVAGCVNGLMPCGLVYAYLALAASAAHLFDGALVMALFGLGTLPAMVLTGLFGSLLAHLWRRRIIYVAAACMMLTGAISIWRGIAAFDRPASQSPTCPGCFQSHEPHS